MDYFNVTLEPRNLTLRVPRGTELQRLLFEHGAEFPCGGRGTCSRCKVKLLKGDLPVTDAEKEIPQDDLDAGVRLACLHTVEEDLTFELEQWGHVILDQTSDFEFIPRPGLGIAFDVGSTTIAGQLIDCETADVIAVESSKNQQSIHGADIMSRITFALEGGQDELCQIVRSQIGDMVARLMEKNTSGKPLMHIALVGNTPMHNLFCGVSVEPLSHYPFEPEFSGYYEATASDLGWNSVDSTTTVGFLPSLGSFVGSDILAGVLAVGLDTKPGLNVFIDLGTNGEIVVSDGERILCASTAAGPAFEAATISMGMQATKGAINNVRLHQGKLACSVIGGEEPVGICGSGLVDAVAALLESGALALSGRFTDGGQAFPLVGNVSLSQKDIRELQLAKGAVAVGIRVLLDLVGQTLEDVDAVYIAGAFGNYINLESGRTIGMLNVPIEKLDPIGNSALLGAKMALFKDGDPSTRYDELISRVEHIDLSSHPRFQDFYMDEMTFG